MSNLGDNRHVTKEKESTCRERTDDCRYLVDATPHTLTRVGRTPSVFRRPCRPSIYLREGVPWSQQCDTQYLREGVEDM